MIFLFLKMLFKKILKRKLNMYIPVPCFTKVGEIAYYYVNSVKLKKCRKEFLAFLDLIVS